MFMMLIGKTVDWPFWPQIGSLVDGVPGWQTCATASIATAFLMVGVNLNFTEIVEPELNVPARFGSATCVSGDPRFSVACAPELRFILARKKSEQHPVPCTVLSCGIKPPRK